MKTYMDILNFWFLPEAHPDFGKIRPIWFEKNPDFDAEITALFTKALEQAKAGYLLHWAKHSKGCLALILLFDQFSRNMFRDTPDAFSTDAKALELANYMQTSGLFDALSETEKPFALLPFEHSESMKNQKKSVALFKKHGSEQGLEYAIRHYDIIKEYGRFPHRNKILGRRSSKPEIEFLKQPHSSF